MYAKLFERMGGGGGGGDAVRLRRGGGGGGGAVRLRRGGGSPLTTGGGGGGEGGCNRQVKLTNSSLTCTHSLLLKTQGTSRQTGPLRTCPVVLHRFVDICPYNRATGTFKYGATRYLLVCRSLSSGRGGGRQKLPEGGISYAMGGAAAPPKAMLDPGLNTH